MAMENSDGDHVGMMCVRGTSPEFQNIDGGKEYDSEKIYGRNRIIEQITLHRMWKELYDTVSYSPALHNLIEDILENKETELTELIRMKESLENIIISIGNCYQREILRLRYFDNLPWSCVANG